MSGIVGIVNLGGRPVCKNVLSRMARELEARAPDGSDVWVDGTVGLGYAHLKLTRDDARHRQPVTLDQQAWIVADARLDNREELASALELEGSDAALILAAYRHYDERFVEHLEGDFAFAIWDKSCDKLICVRDQLGVRPFYFISLDDVFLFSTDIEALKQHPRFRSELDEEFIADFLYFGDPLDAESTVYRQVKRLPAASMLVVSHQTVRLRSYWSVEHVPAVRYRDEREYLDDFNELFERSIRHRIQGVDAGILLSGGMDSGSIAAVAAALKRSEPGKVHGYSLSSADLLPEDDEDLFTRQTAEHLGIPVDFQPLDSYPLFARRDYGKAYPSEPVPSPDLAVHLDRYTQFEERNTRIVLTGEAGDTVFTGSAPRGPLLRVADDVFRYFRRTGSIRGLRLRSLLPFRTKRVWKPGHPGWIDPAFAKRTGGRDRWERFWREQSGTNDDKAQIGGLCRGRFFSHYEVLRLPYVVKHPFLDLRLMTFLLGIPSHQKSNKGLLRRAMEGHLPRDIVCRPKTPLCGDVIQARIGRGDLSGGDSSRMREILSPYIDCERYFHELESRGKSGNQGSTWNSWFVIHPRALADWLVYRHLDREIE